MDLLSGLGGDGARAQTRLASHAMRDAPAFRCQDMKSYLIPAFFAYRLAGCNGANAGCVFPV